MTLKQKESTSGKCKIEEMALDQFYSRKVFDHLLIVMQTTVNYLKYASRNRQCLVAGYKGEACTVEVTSMLKAKFFLK